MATVHCSHLCRRLRISLFCSSSTFDQHTVTYQLSVRGNIVIRSYSNVGKTAAFMMRSTRREKQKRQERQQKNKDIQHWMARNPTRGVKMATGLTDWPSVYSGAKSYHPSVVPIFFRMGRLKHNRPGFALPLRALGNLELMKIPNFFHLSPPAIERHCQALQPSEGDIPLFEFNSLKTNRSFATSHSRGTKPPCWRATDAVRQANKHHVNDKLQRACYGGEASSSQSALCTEWPGSLDLSSVPLRITTRNYLFAGPSLYHPGSRKVKLQVYLTDLVLDEHAKKKLIQLVGPRYNPENDELTIVADRCPTRKQNKDYAMYLLTVLYHESWKTEPWETEKSNDVEESEEEEEEEKARKKRKNPKRVRLIDGTLYRMNQYGKYFKMQLKVKE